MKLKLVTVDLEISPRAKRRALALGIPALILGAGAVGFADVPNMFAAGDPLSSAKINGDFANLDGRLAAVEGKTSNGVVSGSGMLSQVARWTSNNTVGPGSLTDDGKSIGVGTMTPTAKLHVVSNAGDQQDFRVDFKDAGAGPLNGIANQGVGFFTDGGGGNTFAALALSGSNSQNAFAIDAWKASNNMGSPANLILNPSGGDVGIGTTAPQSRLEIQGLDKHYASQMFGSKTPDQSFGLFVQAGSSAADTPFAVNDKDDATSYFVITGDGTTDFYAKSNTVRMRVAPSGNVGIGTTAPAYKLDVNGTLFSRLAANQNIRFTAEAAFGNAATISSVNDAANAFATLKVDGSTLSLNAQSGGNVGIGTTSPSARFHVDGTGGAVTFEQLDTVQGTYPAVHIKNKAASGRDYAWASLTNGTLELYDYTAGGGGRIDVTSAGNVGIGTAAPASRLDLGGGCMTGALCSDARMKTNIRALGGSVLDRFMQLQPSTFEWIAHPEGKERIGVIAQQVERVFPEVVTTAADGGEKGLECTGLNAITIAAVQEQQRIIAEQSSTIAALTRRESQLRQQVASQEERLRRLEARLGR